MMISLTVTIDSSIVMIFLKLISLSVPEKSIANSARKCFKLGSPDAKFHPSLSENFSQNYFCHELFKVLVIDQIFN
ncbi:MAG: hypothetical protein IPF75_06600 [Bacteroidetes bacterium]|nr:hypothetical protein [Bacteroidota bacterium]